MSEEELQALKDEVDALKNKNKELLTEVKKERNKNRELNLEDFNKLTEKVDQLESENSKLNGTIKQKEIEVQKLSTSYQEANGKLITLSKRDEIAKIVETGGFSDEWKAHAIEHLELRSSIKDGALLVDDKNVDDFLKEWTAPTGTGYKMLLGAQHNGGGSNGGNIPPQIDQPKTRTEAYAEMFKN